MMFTASRYFIGFCKAFQLEDWATTALTNKEQKDSQHFTVSLDNICLTRQS